VFFKLHPYIQNLVAAHTNQKLAYKIYGPYRVLERVGKVAYRLELLRPVEYIQFFMCLNCIR
jgi:hypothetical protein